MPLLKEGALSGRFTGEVERSETFVDFQDLDRDNLAGSVSWDDGGPLRASSPWSGPTSAVFGDYPKADPRGGYRLMATVADGNGTPGRERLLDGDICSCCSVGSAAQGQEVLTVYRDHRAGEVRDIAVVCWGQDGSTVPRLLHDDRFVINGCPSNGPAIARQQSRAVSA